MPRPRSARRADHAVAFHQTHAVPFYDSWESLARIAGRFLGDGFVEGLPAIVIATGHNDIWHQHTHQISDSGESMPQ